MHRIQPVFIPATGNWHWAFVDAGFNVVYYSVQSINPDDPAICPWEVGSSNWLDASGDPAPFPVIVTCGPCDDGIETACCSSVPASISGTISSDNADLNGKPITLTHDPDVEHFPGSPNNGAWVGFVAAGSETFGLKLYCVTSPSVGWGAVAACGNQDSDFTHFVTVAEDDCNPFSVRLTDAGMQLACGLFDASLDVTLS